MTWRRDWATWRIWAEDPVLSRRATALAAVAAALCPEKERRLDAGMFQAGLAAERGLQAWKKAGAAPEPATELIEPLEELRNALFAMSGRPPEQDGFLKVLQSEVRVYGDAAVTAAHTEGGVALRFAAQDTEPRSLILGTAYPLKVAARENVTLVGVKDALGFTIVKYQPTAPGRCELLVQPPSWAAPLPGALPLPRYEERLR